MSLELTINGTLAYADSEGADESLSVVDLIQNVTTKKYTKLKQNIGTSEEAIQLGEVSSLGWVLFVNRDTTNFLEIRVGTGGTKFARLNPSNGFALLRLGSGITAPYAIADTAACQMEMFLISQ